MSLCCNFSSPNCRRTAAIRISLSFELPLPPSSQPRRMNSCISNPFTLGMPVGIIETRAGFSFARVLSSVLFPLPLAPQSKMQSPLFTPTSMPSQSSLSPYAIFPLYSIILTTSFLLFPGQWSAAEQYGHNDRYAYDCHHAADRQGSAPYLGKQVCGAADCGSAQERAGYSPAMR